VEHGSVSGRVTNDQRLRSLFAAYELHYLKDHRNIWRPLFYPGTWVLVRFEDIASRPYYNLHFIYAILCDRELGTVPEIGHRMPLHSVTSTRLDRLVRRIS
jgi:hypothetical protein